MSKPPTTVRAAKLTIAGAIALLALAGLGAVRPPGASASPDQFTVLDPTPSLLNGETAARRADILDRLQALGVDAVRIQVQWRFLAPAPSSSHPPKGFDASDPGEYPMHAFDILDSIVRGVVARGMTPLLTPTGPIPAWASSIGRGGLYDPDPAAFEHFVQALGRRYDGTCVPPDCLAGPGEPLPRVERWAVWNEPNLRLFLRPQRLGGRTVSGLLYRRLFLAAQQGLAASRHGKDTLLIGETAPIAGKTSTTPLKFLRQVFCLSARYRPIGDCAPIEADGWSHHPYNPRVRPWEAPKHRSIISIGTIGRLIAALRKAAEAGATVRRLPVYVTEYGVESYPQGGFGVSPQRQAEFLAIAEFLLYRNPWVRSDAQYLLDDDPIPGGRFSFQTGLRFANGFPKPSYDAFPLTLVARRSAQGGVQIWGHVRPGSGPYELAIRFREGDRGPDQELTTVETDAGGYFRFNSPYRKGRQWRAVCELPDGTVLEGPFIRSYRFG